MQVHTKNHGLAHRREDEGEKGLTNGDTLGGSLPWQGERIVHPFRCNAPNMEGVSSESGSGMAVVGKLARGFTFPMPHLTH